MLEERSLRRLDFCWGPALRLADGGRWVFPSADALARERDRHYCALLEGLLDAQDEPERRRAELALGLYLLGRNYEIDPAQYLTLFCFADAEALAAWQAELHGLAEEHLRAAGDRARGQAPSHVADGRPSASGWRLGARLWGRRAARRGAASSA